MAIATDTAFKTIRSTAQPQNISEANTSRLPVLAVLYLLCILIPVGFQVGPLAMTTLRLLLLVMTVPLTVGLISGRFGKIIATDVLIFAHIIWATLALSLNNPEVVIQQSGSVGIEFIGGYLVGRATIRNRNDFAALCRMLIWLVLFTTPFALMEARTGRPYIVEWVRDIPGITSVSPISAPQRMGLERVQSSFAHPIHYGLFCSVTFSLSFVALKGIVSNTRRWVSSGVILLSGLLALSSGALLAMVLQICLISWYATLKSVRQRWWILVGLFALAYVVIDILSNRTPLNVFLSYATFSAHTAYWRTIIFEWGLDNVLGNAGRDIPPAYWFGIGLSDWIRPHYMNSGSMDNFWLVMAVRYGLPGLLFLAIGYVIAIGKVMKRNFEGDRVLKNFRMAWVFTFLGLTFTLCTVHIWTNIYSFVFFMFGAGIWFIAAVPEGEEVAERNVELEEERMRQGVRFTRFDSATSRSGRAPK